jgi:NADH-quinone oxidoreductase subunit L
MMEKTVFPYLFLIPLFPLVSSALIRFFGLRLGRKTVHFLACVSVFASFAVTAAAFVKLLGTHGALANHLYPWIAVGKIEVWTAFNFDSLSSVMTLVVTFVGFLIHVYSTGYMSHEKDFHRYFSYLNLFTAMMLILVLGDSLLTMFVGWEGVGLCSYLLIGFWFNEKANADAGKKAFVVNRVGDFGFIIGVVALFWGLGLATDIWSFDFSVLRTNVSALEGSVIFGVPLITFATLALFIGATGKSAQIPLYVWLPDAMAGPTPVSALIHAATMVTAGVYMIARLSFLFDLAPLTLHVVATVGAATALFAATIGLVQNDIKKVLAYSTVSQLGYMFLACGVGAYAAGIFHVVTHAFFKALLFLGAGSVIHGMSGEQDMRKMGGLRKKMPWTYKTFVVATLAIAGFPGLAGFFSKDEILWQTFASEHGSPMLWGVGALAAFMTAFYMSRLVFMTFWGESRADHETQHHIHESPSNMLIPLQILAVLSIFAGWLWVPGAFSSAAWFPHWLESSVVVHHAHGSHTTEILLMAVSVAIGLAGILLAYRMYVVRTSVPVALAGRFPRVYQLLLNKYWIDELYEKVFVRGTKRISSMAFWFDSRIVDGIVNGSASVTKMIVFIGGTFDRWVVDGLVNFVARLTLWVGSYVRSMQSGQIQFYLGTLAGVFVVISLIWMSMIGVG